MRCAGEGAHLSGFLPKIRDLSLIMRKNIRQTRLRQFHRLQLLKINKIMGNKKRLRSCHRPEDTRETRHVNVLLNPGTEGGSWWKSR